MIQSVHTFSTRWQSFCRCSIMALGLILLLANQSGAQSERAVTFEFGGRVGVPLHSIVGSRLITSGAESTTTSSGATPLLPLAFATVQGSHRPWIAVGPTFAAMIHEQLQLELGAIYKPVRFETETLACADSDCVRRVQGITQHESVRGHLWEFPLTANYYLGHKRIRPYVGGGVVLRQAFGGKSSLRFTDLSTGNEIPIRSDLGFLGIPV
jgi:outer membrane protein W